MNAKSLLREPLFQFFLLGLVVFGSHAVLNLEKKEGPGKDPLLVEVTSADLEWLRSTWNKRMGREPLPRELDGLVDSFIREEILYREAVAMGLDQHDSVVRRRMAQKMDFLFKDLAEMAEPTEEELLSWFEENAERYRVPAWVSFTHVYFSSDRGKAAGDEARAVLARILREGIDPAEAVALGDRFILPAYYPGLSTEGVAREFGRAFAETVSTLEKGKWHGLVPSGYGAHLVFVHERTGSRLPGIEEVREEVVRDLMSERREMINAAAYREIRSKYRVLVENMPYSREGEESQQ